MLERRRARIDFLTLTSNHHQKFLFRISPISPPLLFGRYLQPVLEHALRNYSNQF